MIYGYIKSSRDIGENIPRLIIYFSFYLNNMKKNYNFKDFLSSAIFYLAILTFIIGFNFTDSPPPFGWYQQFMPSLGGRSITDVFFLDSLTGWGVTNATF
jgi:hypothetical protein